MRTSRCPALAVGALALLLGQTIGAQSVYEGFTPSFPLYNTGIGLSGSWQPLSSDTVFTARESSLVFPGLRTSPGRVSARATGGFNGAVRSLTQSLGADNTTAYLSVLLRPQGTLNAGGANDWFGVSLVGNLGPGLFIGKPGGGAMSQYVIENFGGAGQVSSGVMAVVGQTVLLVVKAQFMSGNDIFTLYANPALGVEPVSGGVKTDLDLGTVSQIAIESTGAFDVDEIRIGTTYASVTPRVPDHLLRGGDFDGDSKTDVVVYNSATGGWSWLLSGGGFNTAASANWGGPGYDPVPGDYDGDGKSDVGVYQVATGKWSVLLSSTNFTTTFSASAGGTGWTPVPGDYDGDGKTDVVVYNSTTGQWFGLLSGSSYSPALSTFWGGTGWTAVPGDFDGDGRTDIGVYQITTGAWAVALSSTNYATTLSLGVGGSGWMPVAADYDGDGRADFVVYNTTTGQWYGLKSSTNYTTTLIANWGGAGYAPVRGDYDGDGKADLALYAASTGTWYILLSSSNYTATFAKNWGGIGYAPVPKYP